MHKQVYVCNFFDQALNGQRPLLDTRNVEKIDEQRCRLKLMRNKKNECFQYR